MFDKNQKNCVTCINLATDNGLWDQKAFLKVKIVFIYPLWMMANLSIIIYTCIMLYSKIHLVYKIYIADPKKWERASIKLMRKMLKWYKQDLKPEK